MTSKRILIVDDEKAILSLLKTSIELMYPEYQVVAVSNGLAALAELRQQPFQLILTDFEMPLLNGLVFADAVRQFCPDIPIILMTGSRNDDIQTRANSMNLAGFLAKPFEIKQLKEILQQNGI
jgi:CheY-like chemotaxis protein